MFYLPIPIEGKSGEPVSVQKRKSRGYEYTILKYMYQTLDGVSEPYTVITNESQTKLFAYMAPRETANYYEMHHSDYQSDDIIHVRDSIEGTMITLFWNDETHEWDICTRNGIGGDYSFIHPVNKGDPSPKTFREMVLDVFRVRKMRDPFDSVEEIKDLSDIEGFDDLPKSHCYTCMLQHSSNHLVYSENPFKHFLRLVAIYETGSMPPLVPDDSNIYYADCMRELPSPEYSAELHSYLMECKDDIDDKVWDTAYKVFGYPTENTTKLSSKSELINFKNATFDRYVDVVHSKDFVINACDIREDPCSFYYPPAWILTNSRTGKRCEIANPFYESAKALRNMQPNMRYQYLHLRKQNILHAYLIAFPQYIDQFLAFEKEYEDFVTKVHGAYVKFYIKKERETTIPKQYFVHAARIHHNVYMKSKLEGNYQKINRFVVSAYFEQFSASKMFYYLTNQTSEIRGSETEGL